VPFHQVAKFELWLKRTEECSASLIVSKTRLDNLDIQKQFAEAKREPPIISRNEKALLEELAGGRS
jgi:hypothetical protein